MNRGQWFREGAHLMALRAVLGQYQYAAEMLRSKDLPDVIARIDREREALERSYLQYFERSRAYGLGCNDTPADDLRAYGEYAHSMEGK